ncbi:hypothetical protein O6H91_03G062100 [Diphasiastrum complanatum]|uniref:Uncharacterized protein n=1 Tax=Diphasiastrum complanatum TaxID=34168 RepID=A0ACC2E6Y6_DIPCM|nr:hypothetical protein O6H91_03G062100 [Diphasiastrum complanatum]
MMVDLAAFGEENFSGKTWVNAACRARHADDDTTTADKYLSDLEMKLQLMAENLNSTLEEQSAGALLRVPRSLRDIGRLQDDAVSLRSTVSAICVNLKQTEGSSAESVAALARIDVVKQRMEGAYKTLQDAAGLAQLSANVEDVFASGDLPRVAETLAKMRRCLEVVGEVPEFATVKRQLVGLEDRLEGLVQPRLSDALSQRKLLRDIFITIGRYSSLEQQYSRVRMKPLRRLWEEFEAGKGPNAIGKPSIGVTQGNERPLTGRGTPEDGSVISFLDWLPRFYDEVLLIFELEIKWCTVAFPEDYKTLIPRLMIENMSAISSSFIARIEATSDEISGGSKSFSGGNLMDRTAREASGMQKGETTRLGTLIALHNTTGSFSKNFQHLLSGVELAEIAQVVKAIYSPYAVYKERYGELERAQLLTELASLDLRGAVPRAVGSRGVELSETVWRMEASIPDVTVSLEAAVERCMSFTGGSEAEALIHTLDDVVVHYTATLHDILKSLRAICGVDRAHQDVSTEVSSTKRDGKIGPDSAIASANSTDIVPEEEEWSIVQGALQLLTVADNIGSRFSVFEASLRGTLGRLGHRLQIFSVLALMEEAGTIQRGLGGEDACKFLGLSLLDPAILRLVDAPEQSKRLANLLEQAKDPGFHALPHASQRVGNFMEAINELVYEVLISKVRSRLADVARMPVWNAEEEANVFALPSFSAYPLSYVTAIGEYLLTLPQQLEPLVAGGTGGPTVTENGVDNADEAQYFATEWMFKVAEGATALYLEQIRGIQVLSERGALQLAADIEYLCNVLSALSMATPLVLASFQACVAAPRDKLPELAKKDGGTQLDLATVRLVCKMRRVPLD